MRPPTKVRNGALSSVMVRIALRRSREETRAAHRAAMGGYDDKGLVALRDSPEYRAEVQRVMERMSAAIAKLHKE